MAAPRSASHPPAASLRVRERVLIIVAPSEGGYGQALHSVAASGQCGQGGCQTALEPAGIKCQPSEWRIVGEICRCQPAERVHGNDQYKGLGTRGLPEADHWVGTGWKVGQTASSNRPVFKKPHDLARAGHGEDAAKARRSRAIPKRQSGLQWYACGQRGGQGRSQP